MLRLLRGLTPQVRRTARADRINPTSMRDCIPDLKLKNPLAALMAKWKRMAVRVLSATLWASLTGFPARMLAMKAFCDS